MNAVALGRNIIRWINETVNFIVLMIIMLLMAFAIYALWDSQQVHNVADKSHYDIYKPTVQNEGKTFMQLQAINPEVFSWLTVYGTNIDYPVVQGHDNMKYVSTNAEGAYSMSGAIFLDCHNSKDFSDFNNIIYGHHMEKKTMFGEIGNFLDREMFDSHQYGNLYYNGVDHGVEFFAFVHADAYDKSVFTANAQAEDRAAYLENLLSKAIHQRDIGVTTEDRIVMLSTCSASTTNGRDILVGRITDEVFPDTTLLGNLDDSGGQPLDSRYGLVKAVPLWVALLALLSLIVAVKLAVTIRETHKKSKQRKMEKKRSRKICVDY